MDFNVSDLAYCGLHCLQCSIRATHETGDMAHVLAMPDYYQGAKARTPAELACSGCKADPDTDGCDMKACAIGKGLDHCGQCESFPCEHTNTFHADGIPHHRQAIENLHTIRDIGAEAWFAAIAPTLARSCGTRQSWYHSCKEHT